MTKKKDPHAVILGRRGGKKRVKNQTPEQRSASARYAAEQRWKRVKEEKQGGSSTDSKP